jgi:hypothetical protein
MISAERHEELSELFPQISHRFQETRVLRFQVKKHGHSKHKLNSYVTWETHHVKVIDLLDVEWYLEVEKKYASIAKGADFRLVVYNPPSIRQGRLSERIIDWRKYLTLLNLI